MLEKQGERNGCMRCSHTAEMLFYYIVFLYLSHGFGSYPVATERKFYAAKEEWSLWAYVYPCPRVAGVSGENVRVDAAENYHYNCR
jgi:hypothetical protein